MKFDLLPTKAQLPVDERRLRDYPGYQANFGKGNSLNWPFLTKQGDSVFLTSYGITRATSTVLSLSIKQRNGGRKEIFLNRCIKSILRPERGAWPKERRILTVDRPKRRSYRLSGDGITSQSILGLLKLVQRKYGIKSIVHEKDLT